MGRLPIRKATDSNEISWVTLEKGKREALMHGSLSKLVGIVRIVYRS